MNIVGIHIIFTYFVGCLMFVANIEKHRCIPAVGSYTFESFYSCNLVPAVTLFTSHVCDEQ